jgi:hypothetical protein
MRRPGEHDSTAAARAIDDTAIDRATRLRAGLAFIQRAGPMTCILPRLLSS